MIIFIIKNFRFIITSDYVIFSLKNSITFPDNTTCLMLKIIIQFILDWWIILLLVLNLFITQHIKMIIIL